MEEDEGQDGKGQFLKGPTHNAPLRALGMQYAATIGEIFASCVRILCDVIPLYNFSPFVLSL